MGIPNDLPEPKGLRAKLPDTYEGKDDFKFDRLDNWLQGLLHFFNLHHLTGMDKDADRVLVTETSLKGKRPNVGSAMRSNIQFASSAIGCLSVLLLGSFEPS